MQSVKRLEPIRQFCVTLLYGDRDTGEDFTDLPDLNSRKNKGAITVRFELSPCFSLLPHSWFPELRIHLQSVPTSTNLCHMLPLPENPLPDNRLCISLRQKEYVTKRKRVWKFQSQITDSRHTGQWLPYRCNTLPLSGNPLQGSRLYIPLWQKKQ